MSLVEEIAQIPRDHMTDEATLERDLLIESVNFVELQVALEDEYQIELDPIVLVELNRFGAIVDHVHRCVVIACE